MKFHVHPCDDGRYFIVDSENGTVICHTVSSDLAQQVADSMNAIDCDDACANDDYFDLTKIH
jgi:hypothetical protein